MAERQETDVVIVGAGPSGLTLAIALSHHKVRSTILEKTTEICEDPRAIALAGDTTRILEALGVSRTKLEEISQPLPAVHFHTNAFTSSPFFSITHTDDWLEQIVPMAVTILQPGLETVLREVVQNSEYAELRLGCEVTSINESMDQVQALYRSHNGLSKTISGSFLVGADGKRGYVRKGYLEAKGVEQRVGVYSYEAAWIAANVQINLPNPISHPDFPLWRLGYQPEEVWDIFWPAGFHFCRHPTMPVATGRFGPRDAKFWRFEYELPTNFRPAHLEEHLLQQMKPHLTIAGSCFSRNGVTVNHPVHFPLDCIRVLRCAPANFNNRVVNEWFHGNTMLIGDAAHVFPPFGAQGMASGIRDAFALSWRLALLLEDRPAARKRRQEALLGSWARERREGVDDSSRLTEANGALLLGKSRVMAAVVRLGSGILEYVPSWRDWIMSKQMTDSYGYSRVDNGFFVKEAISYSRVMEGGGGQKIAQVYMMTVDDRSITLSDRFFRGTKGKLTLLLLRRPAEEEASRIKEALGAVDRPSSLLVEEILELCDSIEDTTIASAHSSALRTTRIMPCKVEDLKGLELPMRYDPGAFRRRFLDKALCALVRPDFIVFSQAQTPAELQKQLSLATVMLDGSSGPIHSRF